MRLPLDTHAFLWFIGGSDELSSRGRRLIENGDTDCLLSVARLWEMAIKVGRDRLQIPLPFTRLIREHVTGNSIQCLESPLSIWTNGENCHFTTVTPLID